MTKEGILTALSGLATTHGSTLADIRARNLAGQAGADPGHPLFAGVTLSPSEWQTVGRIQRLAGEVDALFSAAQRELGSSGDALASAVAQHQGTSQRITEAMASLNADIARLTAALSLKSVSFSWSLLPSA